MDLKKELKVGDYVQYDNGKIVCDDDGIPLRIFEIKDHYSRKCVIYNNGAFDYLEDVEKVDPLILELF